MRPARGRSAALGTDRAARWLPVLRSGGGERATRRSARGQRRSPGSSMLGPAHFVAVRGCAVQRPRRRGERRSATSRSTRRCASGARAAGARSTTAPTHPSTPSRCSSRSCSGSSALGFGSSRWRSPPAGRRLARIAAVEPLADLVVVSTDLSHYDDLASARAPTGAPPTRSWRAMPAPSGRGRVWRVRAPRRTRVRTSGDDRSGSSTCGPRGHGRRPRAGRRVRRVRDLDRVGASRLIHSRSPRRPGWVSSVAAHSLPP